MSRPWKDLPDKIVIKGYEVSGERRGFDGTPPEVELTRVVWHEYLVSWVPVDAPLSEDEQ